MTFFEIFASLSNNLVSMFAGSLKKLGALWRVLFSAEFCLTIFFVSSLAIEFSTFRPQEQTSAAGRY